MTTPKQQSAVKQKNILNFFAKASVETPTTSIQASIMEQKPDADHEKFQIKETTPNNDSMIAIDAASEELAYDHDMSDEVQILGSEAPVVSSISLLNTMSRQEEEKDVPQLADLMSFHEDQKQDDRIIEILNEEDKPVVEEVAMDIEPVSSTAADDMMIADDEQHVSEEVIDTTSNEPVTSTSSSSKKRIAKAKQPSSVANEAAAAKPKRAAAKKVVMPAVELSPETVRKIDLLNNRMQHFADELLSFESTSGNVDTKVYCDEAIADLESFTLSSADKEEEEFLAQAVQQIRTIIARAVQGSGLSLSMLLAEVKQVLSKAEDSLSKLTSDHEMITTRIRCVEQMLAGLQDDIILADEIKLLAIRTCFGVSVKSSNPFEETNIICVYRWEVMSSSTFPDSAQTLLKENKLTRSRYGRLISSIAKVAETLSKHPDEPESKVAEQESRVSKLVLELEKAKEKKLEVDRKRDGKKDEDKKKKMEEERLRREADKIKKDQEKEVARLAKLQEKEEEAEKKRKDMEKKKAEKQAEIDEKAREKEREAATKAKVTQEKEQKLQQGLEKQKQGLEKQKNFFMTFLSKAATSSVVDVEAESSSIMPVSRSQSPMAITCFDEDHFESMISSQDVAMSEIIRDYKHKYHHNMKANRRIRRKPKTLYVSCNSASGNNNAFDFSEGYSETKTVTVDNHIKTLRFYTDERPAYVGTFSKRSALLSGRRPFARDIELFNYDYDSEAEWEAEEEDGEDIENSEGGDEEAGDDLMYDEFCLKDNDFGSDADSDGEEMAATMIRHNQQGYVVDAIGVQFVYDSPSAPTSLSFSSMNREECQLRSYGAVMMMPKITFPVLGQIFATIDTNAVTDAEVATVNAGESVAANSSAAGDMTSATMTGEVQSSDAAVKPTKPKRAEKEFEWTNTMMLDLVTMIHGKKETLEKFETMYREKHAHVPKVQIRKKILDISNKEKHPLGYGSMRYMVKSDILQPFIDQVAAVEFTPKQKKRKRVEVKTATGANAKDMITSSPSSSQSCQVNPIISSSQAEDAADCLMNQDLLSSPDGCHSLPTDGELDADVDDHILLPLDEIREE